MDHKIIGTTMPILEMMLAGDEGIIAESGEVAWFTQGMQLDTSSKYGHGEGGGGVFKSMKRAVGGGQIFLTEYRAPSAGGMVAFATKMPGTIKHLPIDSNDEFMVHEGGFICGTHNIEVSIGLQKKLGAAMFGGTGIIFQKLAGQGDAWVELSGEIVEYDLAAGQSLLIHPAHLGLYTGGMNINFQSIKGIKNKFFGSSLFLAEIHGPGHVWLQSLTLPKLAAAIQPYIQTGSSSGGALDAASGIFGN